MHKFSQHNETFLQQTFETFKSRILGLIDDQPEAYFDASFKISAFGGKLGMQQHQHDDGHMAITEKMRAS